MCHTFFFFSSRRRHTRCALVTGVQTCALPIFDLLREAVEPFTVEYVSGIAGVTPRILREAAEAFACTGTRGIATTGTGTDMSPHSNLSEHLIECLNVVCRSEEHTSELQSLMRISYAVFCLKKKTNYIINNHHTKIRQ